MRSGAWTSHSFIEDRIPATVQWPQATTKTYWTAARPSTKIAVSTSIMIVTIVTTSIVQGPQVVAGRACVGVVVVKGGGQPVKEGTYHPRGSDLCTTAKPTTPSCPSHIRTKTTPPRPSYIPNGFYHIRPSTTGFPHPSQSSLRTVGPATPHKLGTLGRCCSNIHRTWHHHPVLSLSTGS